jgi:hypothetical protein
MGIFYQTFVFVALLISTGCSSQKRTEKIAPLVLNTLKQPTITDISTKNWLHNPSLGELQHLGFVKNHFIFLGFDSAQILSGYQVSADFSNPNLIFRHKEIKENYYRFKGSIYAFPVYTNYGYDIFDKKDTVRIAKWLNNAEKPDNDSLHYINGRGSRRPIALDSNRYSFLYHFGRWHANHINYYDTNVLFYTNKLGETIGIGKYSHPLTQKEYLENRTVIYTISDSNNIYYAPAILDSIYKMDIKGAMLCAGRIPNVNFIPFDNRRKEDIAFGRQYMAKSTVNEKIIVLQNHVVLFSRCAKKLLIDADKYTYTVYTKNLLPLYHDTIRYNILPNIYGMGNSFYFFSANWQQLITYDIK